MQFRIFTAIVTAAVVLSACGGGGDGTPDPVAQASSTLDFPLQSGYKKRIATGSSDNYQISGTCAGSATQTASTPSAASFESTTGVSVTQTVTLQLTNCTPASSASTSVSYYDTNYSALGSATSGGAYAVVSGTPPQLPATVKVGDTSIFSTLNVYSNNTKATVTGQRILSYVVQPDTATTAIINLIAKEFNSSNQLLFTQQTRYRISPDGTLTPINIDVQYSTTNTNHLVYTKI
jgi:hypothetical protein